MAYLLRAVGQAGTSSMGEQCDGTDQLRRHPKWHSTGLHDDASLHIFQQMRSLDKPTMHGDALVERHGKEEVGNSSSCSPILLGGSEHR